jgi:hypothetical protein
MKRESTTNIRDRCKKQKKTFDPESPTQTKGHSRPENPYYAEKIAGLPKVWKGRS